MSANPNTQDTKLSKQKGIEGVPYRILDIYIHLSLSVHDKEGCRVKPPRRKER